MQRSNSCGDCQSPVSRRDFLRTAAAVTAVGAVGGIGSLAHAAPSAKSTAESAVARFHASLTEEQKKVVAFDFDHELRKRLNANWHITKPSIDDKFYTADQRAIIHEIIKGVLSPEGLEKIKQQTEYDNGGIGAYSVAMFGDPAKGKFEWELTGRHLTLRADGDSVDRAAFGGPIVYGHGEETAKDNLFHSQTLQVNEVFKALDPKQAAVALVAKAPSESAVNLQGAKGTFPGLSVKEMSSDQKSLVEKTLKSLLSVYREEDVAEVMSILKAGGGLDALHFAFYQQGDLGQDKVWDIWRIEGPNMAWHFRGAPHVHAYINIGVAG